MLQKVVKGQFDMWLIAFILFHLLKGYFSKEIFVSTSEFSKDVDFCGNSTNPCRTIAYAISTIQDDGYTVSIDGGRNPESSNVYLIGDDVLKLKHSTVLQKWERETISPRPILRTTDTKIVIFGNITFVSIEVQTMLKSNIRIIIKTTCPKVSIINSLFAKYYVRKIGTIELHSHKPFDLHVRNSEVRISTSSHLHGIDITLYSSSSWHTMEQYEDDKLLLYNSRILDCSFKSYRNIRIHISNCTIEDTNFDLETMHLVIRNSSFKLGSLTIHGMANVRNSVFDNIPTTITKTGYIIIKPTYIYNTTFKNYISYGGSALMLKRTHVVLIRCSFRNNTSFDSNMPSSLSMDGTIMNLYNCKFQASRSDEMLISVENARHIQFSNTSVSCKDGNYVKSSLFIAVEMGIYYEITYKAVCQTCEKSTYKIGEKMFIKSNELTNIEKCNVCPYNAICEKGKIRLTGGYWGYVDARNNHMKMLSLIACPAYYCCLSTKQCTSYNTCGAHRTGRLCSECLPGFSSDISARYQCIHNSGCHHAKLTFSLHAFLAVIFIVIMLYLKEIILFVKKILKSCEKEPLAENDNNTSDDYKELQLRERFIYGSFVSGDPCPPTQYQVLYTNDINSENYRNTSSFMLSGSLKIFLFFYQAAVLIRIQSVHKIELVFPKFFDFVSTIFNVKLDPSHSKMGVCIFPDINVIQAKIIKMGFIFIVLALLIILWVAGCACQTIKNQKKTLPARSTNTYTQIDDNVPSYCNPPFTVRVKCVYVQFLLIAYASIATFSFDAVYCVDIDGESYLYTQASIKCYQPWQYGMIVFIALWVVPFALSLYIGSKLLFKCSISPMQFLLILSFPPAILGILLERKIYLKRQQLFTEKAMLAKHLLLVVNEPFRESSVGDGSKLCWATLLILRRMLLVIAQTFIMSTITKLYPMALLLFVFVFHHIKMKPFSDNILNDVELASLLVLLSLVFVNMFWANTREFDLMEFPHYKSVGEVLMYYEMLIFRYHFFC